MSKTQITYVYGSDIKSKSNQFKNYPNITPSSPYNTGDITSTASLLPALGYLGAGGIFLFYSIITQPPQMSFCEDSDGSIYLNGDRSPGDICTTCVDGKWVHRNDTDACGGWRPGTHPNLDGNGWVPACVRDHDMACKLCGSCDTCVSDSEGGFTCEEYYPSEYELEECLRCKEVPCNRIEWTELLCVHGAEACCSGVCYDVRTECTYTNEAGKCIVGCPDGQICRSAQCEDIYIQSLVLLDSLIP